MKTEKSKYSKLAVISFISSLIAIFLLLIIWVDWSVAFIGFFGTIAFANYYLLGGIILPIVSLHLIKKHYLKGKIYALLALALYLCWWILGIITLYYRIIPTWSI